MMMPIMRAALVTQLTVALPTQPGGKIHGPAKFPQRARDVSKNAQWARIQMSSARAKPHAFWPEVLRGGGALAISRI